MNDSERRRPWNEGPNEDAPPESWLLLDDDELLLRIETLDVAGDEDERLLEVVTSDRHFFIRQEAAKRVKERRLLFRFEDDRHVGQILVRHLARREDLTYLERISMLSRHVEVRQAAQIQLARVWRRLEQSQPRDTRPMRRVSLPARPERTADPGTAQASTRASGTTAAALVVPVTSAPIEGDEVDGSLLGWAAHFLVEQAWSHLGTKATLELLRQSHQDLAPAHATLAHFGVAEDARVTLDLASGPRLPRAAVRDVATWMVVFRKAVQSAAPDGSLHSVRASTSLMADALRAAGFYAACDELETAVRA
jgi:hypothetical protein